MSSSMSQALSSYGKRRGTAHDDIDRSVYAVGQTLASIVNDPRTAGQTGGGFFGFGGHEPPVAADAPPPPIDAARYPPVAMADVAGYLRAVHGSYDRFVRDRASLETFDSSRPVNTMIARGGSGGSGESSPFARGSGGSGGGGGQGEAFMAALQQVPAQYFSEDFESKWDDFFEQFCQNQTAEELYGEIDELNKNLDVVEVQLLREVAARSASFFQAASQLQGLRGSLADSLDVVRSLRRHIAGLDGSLYLAAVGVAALQRRRGNLVETLEVAKALGDVLDCRQALEGTVESEDYAGALELLDQISRSLDSPLLLGLRAVRDMPAQLDATADAVRGSLASEFLAALADEGLAGAVAAAAAQEAAVARERQRGDGADIEPQPGSPFLRRPPPKPAAPLQTPSRLAFPAPAAPGPQSEAAAALYEKLLPLAVGLWRADKLGAALAQYKENAAAEVKGAVRDAVQQLLPALLAAASGGGGDGRAGAAGREGSGSVGPAWSGAAPEAQLAEQLQSLQHGAFMQLLRAVASVLARCCDHALLVARVVEEVLAGAGAHAGALAAIRKDCAAALQGAVDAGQGRWVKLLGARSSAHMRLRLYELKQLLDASEEVAAYVEGCGARTLGSFRSSLQAQCKAFLDSQHSRCTMQLQHLLESEQWAMVEVPASFQNIVDRLTTRSGEGAAMMMGPGGDAPRPAGEPRSPLASSPTKQQQQQQPGQTQPQQPGQTQQQQQQVALLVNGRRFHLVNSALMLLKMIDDYMALYDIAPQFGAEIVHRELELLKQFNSQTCQLVLGAGAMRTAGLRSISAKQLALSCQCIGMLAALHPLLRAGSLALVSQPRRALLIPEFDRLLTDLTLHTDEIHTKLVDIMRDRLAAAVAALPNELQQVSVNPGEPSPSVAGLARQLMTLRAVLTPLLLKEELEYIFGAIVRSFSEQLSEALERPLSQGGAWEPAVRASALYMLQAFRTLPIDPARSSSYSSRLSIFYAKHFGPLPVDKPAPAVAGAGAAAAAGAAQAEVQRQTVPPPPPTTPPLAVAAAVEPAPALAPQQQQQQQQEVGQQQQEEVEQQHQGAPLEPSVSAVGSGDLTAASAAAATADANGGGAEQPEPGPWEAHPSAAAEPLASAAETGGPAAGAGPLVMPDPGDPPQDRGSDSGALAAVAAEASAAEGAPVVAIISDLGGDVASSANGLGAHEQQHQKERESFASAAATGAAAEEGLGSPPRRAGGHCGLGDGGGSGGGGGSGRAGGGTDLSALFDEMAAGTSGSLPEPLGAPQQQQQSTAQDEQQQQHQQQQQQQPEALASWDPLTSATGPVRGADAAAAPGVAAGAAADSGGIGSLLDGFDPEPLPLQQQEGQQQQQQPQSDGAASSLDNLLL